MANKKVTAAFAQNTGVENLYTDEGDGTYSPNVRVRGGAITTALPAGEAHLGKVGGELAIVAATELTRPNDTNAYAAKDVIANSVGSPTVITFTDAARITNGAGYITKVRLMTDQKTNTARYRLHFFHTTPTAVGDNVAYPLLYANRANRIGQLDLPAAASEDSATSTAASTINIIDRMPFVCAVGDDNIYAMLETLDAFNPAAQQKFYLELTIDRY